MAFIKRKKEEKKKVDNNPIIANSPEELLFFAKEHGISIEPLDVTELTKKLGIQMRMEPMEGEESGCLKKDKLGKWIMIINSLQHPHRQRFTIAHELGHFIKHTIIKESFVDTTFFRNEESNPMEHEANKFAAELLMPKDLFVSYIENISQQVNDLAKHFQVSSMAVRIRAKQLGYGGHNL
ncbi:ImmA/IrrE family metallo-endopeptidase [Pectobacterium versatile]|uniref:ImmA/IrrE family metallo-endopeptidase n=1 Tax=Pectobacterium versatile TaxID=2488639 RepID=UPI0019697C0D|nr:ImmA/IrrE family metallo-endopeptidase [Pectobacterium versatile]MBN3239837.1 ImmA/IrrE family metallo-endopeptidase [Pectobacterium versatile]